MTVLKLLMKIHDLNLHDVGEIVGIGFNCVARWTRNDCDIPDKFANKLAAYFNVSKDVLQEEVTSKHIQQICKLFN